MLVTMVMTCVVMYLYTVVAFNLLQKYYTNQGEVLEPHYDSMLQLKVSRSCDCHVTVM